MARLQKWQLLKTEDVSPSPHFPLEKRTVFLASPNEIDLLIESGEMNEGQMIADWYLVTKKFPELFK